MEVVIPPTYLSVTTEIRKLTYNTHFITVNTFSTKGAYLQKAAGF